MKPLILIALLMLGGCELIDPPPADPYARAQWQAKYDGIRGGWNDAARNYSYTRDDWQRYTPPPVAAPIYQPPRPFVNCVHTNPGMATCF